MDFVKLKYTGRQVYRDRTPLRTIWQPGDIRPVLARDAKKLLQFAEFEKAGSDDVVDSSVSEQVSLANENAAAQKDRENLLVEDVLMQIANMDKGTLEEYAQRYSVNLDRRKSVENLRAEVSGLVESLGVM